MEILVSKDSKGKIRVVELDREWNDQQHGYVIHRTTYQYGGKRTIQPDILIQRGKVNRTVTEQANLEYNSHKKKYLDKGYKLVTPEVKFDDINALYEFLGDNKTNQEGILKPMLAKQADKIASSVFNNDFYGSRKVNGTRCLIYWKDHEIKTASRGSISYDLTLYHIIRHPKLIDFFKKHPEVILDGEIYKHGWPLNRISGMCRSQSTVDETKPLEFYWYDIVDLEKPFSERWELMQEYASELELLEFDPIREWKEGELKIQLLPQKQMTGWSTLMKYHNEYVKEGWEGLVIRKASGKYGPGKRTNDMIKIKIYKDSEYEIVGLSEGLRDEDMCFVMKTSNGQEFKAKPMGDREQKQWYRDHLDELIGKMATIKYFEMSGKEGSEIPQQPIFVAIREDL